MSDAKFTKGEWFIEKEANWNDDCWAINVKRDYDDSIHRCFAEVVYKMEYEDRNVELEANAHLIAAAPEMYEEIERDIGWLGMMKAKFVLGSYEYKSICLRIESKQKLLAKARGEHNA